MWKFEKWTYITRFLIQNENKIPNNLYLKINFSLLIIEIMKNMVLKYLNNCSKRYIKLSVVVTLKITLALRFDEFVFCNKVSNVFIFTNIWILFYGIKYLSKNKFKFVICLFCSVLMRFLMDCFYIKKNYKE